MQLALDLETINDTLFDGLGDTTPYGVVGPGVPGYFIPFGDERRQLAATWGHQDHGPFGVAGECLRSPGPCL